jgi:hypothetical protein
MGSGSTRVVDPDPDPYMDPCIFMQIRNQMFTLHFSVLSDFWVRIPDPASGNTIQSRDLKPNLFENVWSGLAQKEYGPANYVHTCYVSKQKRFLSWGMVMQT